MRFSAFIILFTASVTVALPAALDSATSPIEERAIECPPKSAANTACTAGRGAFDCNGSYVSIVSPGFVRAIVFICMKVLQ